MPLLRLPTSTAYYNGIPTIVAKTQLALDQTSGMMIWELCGDVRGDLSEYSLLAAIDRSIHTSGAPYPATALPLYLYPNPAIQEITIEQPVVSSDAFIQIIDTQGDVQWQGGLDSSRKINVSGLPQGVYILKLQSEGKTRGKRFVKM